MDAIELPERYRWLTPDTMFQYRDPREYLELYAEDWRTITNKYGDEQLTIIYDWLYKRILSLKWGQYIVIEKDALSLSSNLWMKGKFAQWNVSDDERIRQFRWIAFLMIEWIWRNNDVAVWSMTNANDETRLTIVEPATEARRKLYELFGHWPLAQPSIRQLLYQPL